LIVDKGIIPILIKLMESEHSAIIEQAVWCIGNIAGDSVKHRDTLLQKKAINIIVNKYFFFKKRTDTNARKINQQIIWCISNLCRSKPAPDPRFINIAIDP